MSDFLFVAIFFTALVFEFLHFFQPSPHVSDFVKLTPKQVNIWRAQMLVVFCRHQIDQDKVTNRLTKVELVGGSAQGGLTFLGLGALLTKAKVTVVMLACSIDSNTVNSLSSKVPFPTKEQLHSTSLTRSYLVVFQHFTTTHFAYNWKVYA